MNINHRPMKEKILYSDTSTDKIKLDHYEDGVYKYTSNLEYTILYKLVEVKRYKFLWWGEYTRLELIVSIPTGRTDEICRSLKAQAMENVNDILKQLNKLYKENNEECPDVKVKYEYY